MGYIGKEGSSDGKEGSKDGSTDSVMTVLVDNDLVEQKEVKSLDLDMDYCLEKPNFKCGDIFSF